jgi:hypothetical protein
MEDLYFPRVYAFPLDAVPGFFSSPLFALKLLALLIIYTLVTAPFLSESDLLGLLPLLWRISE